MFLKSYSGLSDDRLLETLSGSIEYQFFCGIFLPPGIRLSHRQRVSDIRCELAQSLSISEVQQILSDYWSDVLNGAGTVLMDATCYESEVRYPTDVKLLWEAVSSLYRYVRKLRRGLGLRMIRSKYIRWQRRYAAYAKQKKPRVQKRRQLIRAFLKLLKKLLANLPTLDKETLALLSKQELIRLSLIKKVYQQQRDLFYEQKKPKGRIVSLAKPYLRPIIRGKEKKPVEFGAKVHKLQIDGLNFIELIHFEAFHEGNRLPISVAKAHKLAKAKIKRLAADAIYATNANRKFCSKRKIFTDFRPKGRKARDEKQRNILRKALRKERVSRLEGSFGNEKNAYHLRKVRAKTKENEILWIFFGIHTANAVEVAKRRNIGA